ncbi:MAG: hypothetical protein KJN63_01915 [Acidimicrobiia bacterium]|nr:hypothetical protein [Acidimicrobiia bacterium]
MAKRGPTRSFEQDAVDLLLHELAEIEQTFATRGEEIWGFGFDPMDIPMLFVARSADSEDVLGICFGPVDRERLGQIEGGEYAEILDRRPPTRRRDDTVYGQTPVLWVNSSIVNTFTRAKRELSFESGLADSEGLVFDCSNGCHRPQPWEFGRFVVHEAFHLHQLFEAKWQVPVGYDPATPPQTDPENGRVATNELRLLEIAIFTQEESQVLEMLDRYVQLRATRHDQWPETELLERGTEQVEGSARYVENQYSRCNGRPGRLALPPEALHQDQDWIDCGRLYRSGARMLELLDRFDVPWRKRLTHGEDPYSILCQTLL